MTYLRKLILGAACLFAAVPSAQALSCLQTDISQDLQQAQESEKLYYILVGTVTTPKVFTLPQEKQTHKPSNGVISISPQSRSQTITGTFSGYSLASDPQLDVPLSNFPITVNVICFSHWCGSKPRNGERLIAFFEIVDGGPPVLTRGPCPAFSYSYDVNKLSLIHI